VEQSKEQGVAGDASAPQVLYLQTRDQAAGI
jgi:hypothetical protein